MFLIVAGYRDYYTEHDQEFRWERVPGLLLHQGDLRNNLRSWQKQAGLCPLISSQVLLPSHPHCSRLLRLHCKFLFMLTL